MNDILKLRGLGEPVIMERFAQLCGRHGQRKRIGLLSLAITFILFGCDANTRRQFQSVTSQAKAEVSNLRMEADSRIINDEPDFGIKISFTVLNRGKSGIIKIMPWLSSSEGEWTRTQNLEFSAFETKTLTFFFHEPTINATNLQGGANVEP